MPARPLSVFLRMASNLVEVGRREMNTSVGNNIMRNGLELVYLINQASHTNLIVSSGIKQKKIRKIRKTSCRSLKFIFQWI